MAAEGFVNDELDSFHLLGKDFWNGEKGFRKQHFSVPFPAMQQVKKMLRKTHVCMISGSWKATDTNPSNSHESHSFTFNED